MSNRDKIRPWHEAECLEQPDEFPCICDNIHERQQEEYEDALIEDAIERNDIPGIARDMIDAGE